MHYPRSILHNRRLIADALRPKMITGVALRIAGRFPTRRAHRAVAVFANFADSYQIDPDLSIIKCLYRNPLDPEMHLECAECGDQDP